jgi:hypothetical protein
MFEQPVIAAAQQPGDGPVGLERRPPGAEPCLADEHGRVGYRDGRCALPLFPCSFRRPVAQRATEPDQGIMQAGAVSLAQGRVQHGELDGEPFHRLRPVGAGDADDHPPFGISG